MMHRPWSSIVEVPYCFSRSSVKFQGHTALKIVKFYRNWAFLDSNSSLNSLMVMKCCIKLEIAKERCPIVFQSHPSNFKVTRDKTSPLLTRIGRFRTIGRSQLSNPSDLPCYILYHFPILIRLRQLKSVLKEGKNLCVIHGQYHGCWWSGDVRSQGISSHDIGLVYSQYSIAHMGRVDRYWWLSARLL